MTTLQGLDRPRATYPVALGRGARRRFETELRALVDVPWTAGLLPVAGGGLDGDGHPFVERALDGLPPLTSLGHQVRQEGRPLDVDTAVTAVLTVLDGVAALHRAGLMHGAIRPEVVLTGAPSGAVLADPVPLEVVTRTGPLGPAFAAPEVLQGEQPTPAADVYAVAATLVYLITGRGPWTGPDADPERVLLEMVSTPQPDLGSLVAHPGVAAAVVRALAAEPTTRPDAPGLAEALSRGSAGGPGTATSASATDRLDTVSPFVRHVPVASTAAGASDPAVTTATAGAATAAPAAATPLGSRYLLHERIGRGATGEVFRATCHAPSGGGPPTEVAVKVLREELADDPTVVARFLGERTTLLGLDHTNLVRVRDLVVEGSTMAIVMDLVDGPDLRRWMRTAPPLPPAAACRLLAQIAGALAAVHSAGVVHRDLKPENVLLERVGTADLEARLTDFGVARSVRDAAARLTQHGQVVGTPAYLAPEVTTGTRAGPPADVYALGVLGYELLVGCRPFPDDQAVALAHAHATLDPGRPPGLDDRLWQVLSWCLAKDPATRPAAGGLTAALVDVATAVGDDAPPIPRLGAPPAPVPARPSSPSMAPGPSSPASAPPPSEATTPSQTTTPPGAATPPNPGAARAPAPPRAYDPDDHLLTDVGTAPPRPRPPEETTGRDRRRRRLYVLVGVGVAMALLAGIGVGLLTLDREPDAQERPAAPEVTFVYLATDGQRLDPDRVNLTFTPLPEADAYRVIRDPRAENGHADMQLRVAQGASFVEIADAQNHVPHCYVVQAVVLQEPSSSTTTSTQPPFLDQYCPDGEPPS